MKILGLVILILILVAAGGLFFLAQKSKSGSPPGIVNGKLAPCPSSPNCVSSEENVEGNHRVSPLPVEVWDKLPDIIQAQGGRIVETRENYLAAEFSSKLMGFVDDVEFRKAASQVHVRSASRVGYSDRGVNRKRIEALRAALAG